MSPGADDALISRSSNFSGFWFMWTHASVPPFLILSLPRTAGSRQTLEAPISQVNFARISSHSSPVRGRLPSALKYGRPAAAP